MLAIFDLTSLILLQNKLECLSLTNMFSLICYLLLLVRHHRGLSIPGKMFMLGTNTLAYFEGDSMTTEKKFDHLQTRERVHPVFDIIFDRRILQSKYDLSIML